MPTIDATVGGSDSNSYVTLAEATTYFGERRLHTDDWDNASQEEQEKALIWATRLLDKLMVWRGVKLDTSHALRWPRGSVTNRDGWWVDDDVIPQDIKDAQFELALSLLKSDRSEESDLIGSAITSMTVGPLSASIDLNNVIEIIPEHVLEILNHWGHLREDVGKRDRMRQLKLKRT